jgi:hypothetical protein
MVLRQNIKLRIAQMRSLEHLRNSPRREAKVFPSSLIPNSVTKSTFFNIEASSIDSEEKLEDILSILWNRPESPVYILADKGIGLGRVILKAASDGIINLGSTEMFWYMHPMFKQDFIHIDRNTNWRWEKDVMRTQAMLTRTQIALSEKARRQRELDELAKIINSKDT